LRNYRSRTCRKCGNSAYRLRTAQRTLHDLGDPVSGRPRDLHLIYSQHRCPRCNHYFSADMLDLTLPNGHYTHRVVGTAVRIVVEDGLPYRAVPLRIVSVDAAPEVSSAAGTSSDTVNVYRP
jgi:hypothetical protein